jgi:integrase
LPRAIDPLGQKKASQEAAAARKTTFHQCAVELIKSKRHEWRSETHARQWASTINRHCGPILDTPVAEVDTAAVLAVLRPVWGQTPETASRVRGRIESILDFAKANKLRSGENPAMWRGNLAMILPKRPKLSRSHHAALPYQDVPPFLAKVRESNGVTAAALEFTILTATRTGEVLGAVWGETFGRSRAIE